jgi:hypothetical protein
MCERRSFFTGATPLIRRKEKSVTVQKKEMGEYRNPSRAEILRDNAERLKKREKEQEKEAAAARRPRSIDRSPETVRRSGFMAASRKEGDW